MGKLVEQDPSDEPAMTLIDNVQKQVKHLTSKKLEKKIKFEPVPTEKPSFQLPNNWCWVRLGSLLRSLKYGTSKKCTYDEYGTAVLRIPNIDVANGCINTNDLKYTELSDSEVKELGLRMNDLLMIRSNGSKSLVGRVAVVNSEEEGLGYAGYLVRLRLFPEYVYSRYIHSTLNTVFVRKQIELPIRTTSGVKNINSTEISNLLIPLPPLPEQHRIVAKVDQLMILCDTLEQHIDNATDKQTALLNAVMAQV